MAHFGIHDGSIPEEGARAFASAQPMVETYFYDAGHGLTAIIAANMMLVLRKPRGVVR